LDGLRGVAAICVVVFHAHTFLRLYNLMPHAYLAVDFFFVLSGFVISHGFGGRFSDRTLGFVEFAVLRLRRLAPLNVAGAVIGATLALAAPKLLPHALGLEHQPLWVLGASVAASFLLLPVIVAGCSAITPVNPPAWSLFFEMVANLGYGLVARFLSKTVLMSACAVLAVGLVAYAVLIGTVDIQAPLPLLATNALLRSFFGFSMGLLMHRLWQEGWRAPKAPVWAICLGLIVAFQVPGAPSTLRAFTDLLSLFVIFPMVVWFGASAQKSELVMRKSGEVSFPIYALHFLPVVMASTFIDQTFHNKLYNLAFLIVAIPLLIVISLGANHWDEKLRSYLSPHSRKVPKAARPGGLTLFGEIDGSLLALRRAKGNDAGGGAGQLVLSDPRARADAPL
jgi:peptidoglycan/LPS O-acetylase OafA/YrhL